jgi:hypothetical protein
VSALPLDAPADDYLAVYDVSGSANKKVTINNLLSVVQLTSAGTGTSLVHTGTGPNLQLRGLTVDSRVLQTSLDGDNVHVSLRADLDPTSKGMLMASDGVNLAAVWPLGGDHEVLTIDIGAGLNDTGLKWGPVPVDFPHLNNLSASLTHLTVAPASDYLAVYDVDEGVAANKNKKILVDDLLKLVTLASTGTGAINMVGTGIGRSLTMKKLDFDDAALDLEDSANTVTVKLPSGVTPNVRGSLISSTGSALASLPPSNNDGFVLEADSSLSAAGQVGLKWSAPPIRIELLNTPLSSLSPTDRLAVHDGANKYILASTLQNAVTLSNAGSNGLELVPGSSQTGAGGFTVKKLDCQTSSLTITDNGDVLTISLAVTDFAKGNLLIGDGLAMAMFPTGGSTNDGKILTADSTADAGVKWGVAPNVPPLSYSHDRVRVVTGYTFMNNTTDEGLTYASVKFQSSINSLGILSGITMDNNETWFVPPDGDSVLQFVVAIYSPTTNFNPGTQSFITSMRLMAHDGDDWVRVAQDTSAASGTVGIQEIIQNNLFYVGSCNPVSGSNQKFKVEYGGTNSTGQDHTHTINHDAASVSVLRFV